MATRMVPVTSTEKNYRFRIDFEGSFYRFDFKFNNRDGFWYFDLLDDDSVRIISGRKLVIGFPLLRLVADRNRPLGEFFAWDTRDLGNEAGTDDLGTLVELGYLTSDEISA